MRWYGVDPCFVSHTLNAYDDGDRVVVDVCRYDGAFDVSRMTGPGPVALVRWTIDPVADAVAAQHLDDRFQEFPRVDDRIISRPYRHGYSTAINQLRQAIIAPSGQHSDDALSNVLLKHDVVAGKTEVHSFGKGDAAGEGVFAPASRDAAEDNGYVIAFVHELGRGGATDLVILAAPDFTAKPVARVHLPARVPLGFHGSWIPDV